MTGDKNSPDPGTYAQHLCGMGSASLDAGLTRVERALAFAANPPMNPDGYAADYCYTPCENGVHVCGHHPDGVNCLTVVNLPTATPAQAREVFEALRQECGARDGEPDDYVVDLNQGGDCGEDFMMTRQMLEPLIRRWGALTEAVPASRSARTHAAPSGEVGPGNSSNTTDGVENA